MAGCVCYVLRRQPCRRALRGGAASLPVVHNARPLEKRHAKAAAKAEEALRRCAEEGKRALAALEQKMHREAERCRLPRREDLQNEVDAKTSQKSVALVDDIDSRESPLAAPKLLSS
eukprot:Rhum_TRINITY_DN14786_c2_g3::Rhum_TRINITY_DN14786_c2_g3_i2::g.115927::m.115927